MAVESLARRYEALRPHLTERQRRLWLGAEARELGPGGTAAETVRRGREELDDPAPPPVSGSRRAGGGRKRAEVGDPELVAALERLVDPESRGDPCSPLRWTCKSTRALSVSLREAGHQVSEFVVRRLLKQLGYSLQANAKTAEGRQHPDRDAQFRYLNEQVKAHQEQGAPVISVDTKKKELIGEYKNGGREWHLKGEPTEVNVYDFIDGELGKAIPYGVYDLGANTGWVAVGTDHDTAAFAVATIARWWEAVGQSIYPGATQLLITADGGGSNGYRCRQWKTELAGLAARTGLKITVCHLPPGTSKWNKIEHRLFSHISMNWRGRPLTSHEVVVETIGATTTRTGLSVHAELDQTTYPTGIKIPDKKIKALEVTGALHRHAFHGEWNYTLRAQPDTPHSS